MTFRIVETHHESWTKYIGSHKMEYDIMMKPNWTTQQNNSAIFHHIVDWRCCPGWHYEWWKSTNAKVYPSLQHLFLSLQVVLDKNICWNTGPAQFYEWNHFHQYIQRQTKPSIYNHFQAASDCLKGLRVTFFNLQGLDTTGKLPAPPKSLGLPGRSNGHGGTKGQKPSSKVENGGTFSANLNTETSKQKAQVV